MKQDLYKLVDSIISNDDDGAKEYFSAYISDKTSSLIRGAEQHNSTQDSSEYKEEK